MLHYFLGFWSGIGCAIILYFMWRLGRELWFAMEWDVMTQAAKKELDGKRDE